jgi:tRNA pseudouridine55 synthase
MSTETLTPDGVLIVNKHAGVTSHDIVGMVRRLFGTRAVGHAGTLDPMATGVLVVLLGRAAKATEYLSGGDKRYIATLRLGLTTDTQDTTGTVLTTCEVIPDEEQVQAILPDFRGEIMQMPPMYSALKVGGKKLVDLARQGVTVERRARPVTVHALTAAPTDRSTDYTLDVTCSGGTYIRTLCEDIGQALGCGGAMASLCRATACGFTLDESVTIEELEAMDRGARLARLRPTESLFAHLPSLTLPAFYDRLIGNGCAVSLSKLRVVHPLGTRTRLYHSDGRFFALGEVVSSDEGLAIKSIKTFIL